MNRRDGSGGRATTRPAGGAKPAHRIPLAWLVAGLFALLLLTPLASELPDGLEFAAERLGLEDKPAVAKRLPTALAPDYAITGLGEGGASKAVAGLAGVVLMLAIGKGLTWLWNRPGAAPPDRPETE